MTAKEIIYNIRNLMDGGNTSDDYVLSDRQLLFIVNYYRAKLIRQELDKGQSLDDSLVQEWTVELDDKGITKEELPKFIQTHKGDTITYVGSTTGRRYQRLTDNEKEFACFSRYTSKSPKWILATGKVEVVFPDCLPVEKVLIKGVPEDPIEGMKKAGIKDPMEQKYPVGGHMLDTIYKLMMEAELRLLFMGPQDITNEGKNFNDKE